MCWYLPSWIVWLVKFHKWKLLIYLPPCSGNSFLIPSFQNGVETSQFREGNLSHSKYHYCDLGQHRQLVFQGASEERFWYIASVRPQIERAIRDLWLWSELTAHMKRLCRFPELTSVYLPKPITAKAATATRCACSLSISCLVTSHSSDLPQQA